VAADNPGRMTDQGHAAGESARVEIRIEGRVQGVGFRWFVRREALGLDLAGWVANRSDGSVEAVAEGSRGALERFIESLSAGPPGANVSDVDVQWGPPTRVFEGFAIRSGSHPGD